MTTATEPTTATEDQDYSPDTSINTDLVQREQPIFFLNPKDIQVSPEYDPRRYSVSARRVQDMAESLVDVGQIQPIGVRASSNPKDKRPMVVYGYTRHAAASKICEDGIGPDPEGAFLLACTWSYDDDQEAYVRAVRENNDRNDLSRIDRAHITDRLKAEFGYTQTAVGRLLGVSPATVTQDLKLLKLIPKIQRMIHDGKMSPDAALELTGMSEEEQEAVLGKLKGTGRGRGRPSKTDMEEAAAQRAEEAGNPPGDDGAAPSSTPVKPKAKSAKVILKHMRETYSLEALEEEGWTEDDAKTIAAWATTFESFTTGITAKGKRSPASWKQVMVAFGKMLGVE